MSLPKKATRKDKVRDRPTDRRREGEAAYREAVDKLNKLTESMNEWPNWMLAVVEDRITIIRSARAESEAYEIGKQVMIHGDEEADLDA